MIELGTNAENALRAHLNANAPELIRELATEDDRLGKELKAAEAKALKLLDPPRQEAREIGSALAAILGHSDFVAEDVFAAHRQPVASEQVEAA